MRIVRICLTIGARLLLSVGAGALTIGQAAAQEAPPPAAEAAQPARDAGVQDIVVTAQRRAENMQSVPVTVSAVTAKALAANGIEGLDTLQVAVPSLSTQSVNGYLGLHLRGVGSIANGPGFENPVALYIDGVYYGNQSIGLTQFNNIERIEVLKGPQGTLFGRNATGGLTQIITRDPGQDTTFNGSFSYGNYNTVDAQLYASGPVTDNLAADFAFHFGRHDGWGENLTTGKEVYASKHDIAVRSKIVWTPGKFKFTLIGDYTDRVDSSAAFSNVQNSLVLPGLPRVSLPNAWDTYSNTQPRLEVRGGGVSLKAETTLGDISVSNLAAYREGTFSNFFDYDGSALPMAQGNIQQKDWQFSDELQFSSPANGPFTWVAGAYYYRARGIAQPLAITFANDPSLNPSFPVGTVAFRGNQDTESVSGYAQGTLKLTDRLGLTAGARYTWEKRGLDARADATLYLPGSPVIPAVPETRKSKTFSQPTFRASIDYKPVDHVLLYASVNTGFKSGGFNVTVPTDPFYKPEKITAYEIGEKADLFDRRVRLNTALFYYDYRNLQVQLAETAGTGIINGARARIYGLDSELTLFPTRRLEINGGLSLLHATFRNFPAVAIGTPGGGFPVTTGSATGNDLPYAPRSAFNLSGTYTLPLGANELVANATWLHSAHFFHEADNVVQDPAYDKINASLTLNLGGGRYSIAAFGNNLTDAKVRSVVLTIPSGQEIQLLQPPRTYGVRFGFKF